MRHGTGERNPGHTTRHPFNSCALGAVSHEQRAEPVITSRVESSEGGCEMHDAVPRAEGTGKDTDDAVAMRTVGRSADGSVRRRRPTRSRARVAGRPTTGGCPRSVVTNKLTFRQMRSRQRRIGWMSNARSMRIFVDPG